MNPAPPTTAAADPAPAALLLRLCSRTEQPDPITSSQTTDWDALLNLAERHRVLPTLYASLRRASADPVPAEVTDRLRGYVQANAAVALRLAGELRRLLAEFDRARIPVIPFKGIVLAATVYGDLCARDAGDLDLLVRRDDIVRAADLLLALGHRTIHPTATPREAAYLDALTGRRRTQYLRSHSEHHLFYEPTRLNVDLHWALALREFAVPLDTAALWSRAARVNVAGAQVLSFAPEDLLLILCLNGAKDAWERLDRVLDVAALLHRHPDLDWTATFHRARRTGMSRMLRLALVLAENLLAAPLAPEANRFAHEDPRIPPIATEVRARLLTPNPPPPRSRAAQAAFDLRLRERPSDRARYCLAQLPPGVGDWAALPLPPALSFLHYLLRPFRLTYRHLRPPQRQSQDH